MEIIEHGTMKSGQVLLSAPVGLPDGTEVVVYIEPVSEGKWPSDDPAEFTRLPVFGMWADREDMRDSAAWISQEREKWRHRLSRE